jgi:hypothetical protein
MAAMVGCSDEASTTLPTIRFGAENEYTQPNDTVSEGQQVKFHIIAEAFEANVTNIVVVLKSGDSSKTKADFGVWKSKIDTVLSFYKGGFDQEDWVFTIMDQNRNFASAQMHVVRNPVSSFGQIVTYPSITLGYQQNNGPHFFDTQSGASFTTESAAANQNLIDVVVYYYLDNGKPSPTFSSPGDQDASYWYPAIKAWSTLNYTKYDYVSKVTVPQFDAATNDSLLIKAYDDVWGRRKYKYCLAGTVFPFKTSGGKIGLVKIIRSDLNETGTLEFSMKVQK